jgi:hypothetical protein
VEGAAALWLAARALQAGDAERSADYCEQAAYFLQAAEQANGRGSLEVA